MNQQAAQIPYKAKLFTKYFIYFSLAFTNKHKEMRRTRQRHGTVSLPGLDTVPHMQ